MRSLVQIYALAVCFATLMCFVVALGIGVYDLVQIAAPHFTLGFVQPFQSNDAFVQYYPDKKDLNADEITRLRETGFRDSLAGERRAAAQSLVFNSILLVIDSVVFLVHWKIAQKGPQQAQAAAELPTGEVQNCHLSPAGVGRYCGRERG